METFINILEIIAFILKAVLGMSVIVLVAMVGTYVHDEIKELRADRTTELDRSSEIESFLSELVAKARKAGPHKAKHRFKSRETHYTHGADDTYLVWASNRKKYTTVPADDSWAAALLQEQKEMAPLWT